MSKPRRLLGPDRRFPHCPNPDCRFHRPDPDWRFFRFGIYRRKSDGRSFVRYQCRTCRRTFCVRTFATDYWLRYRELLLVIASQAINGSGLRQIGRNLGIAHSTVQRHVARAGRHCLLFHWSKVSGFEINEQLVVDGFETFEYSQYFPYHFNLAAGKESQVFYFFTHSPLRRKGSMTAPQKVRRKELEDELGPPDPKAVEKGMLELLLPLRFAREHPELQLHSDDHPAYPRSLRKLRTLRPELRIQHFVTSSKQRRTQTNPLFTVNLMDLLIRHGQANHKRETIAFSKRLQGGAERQAIFAVWRNWIKKWLENDSVDQSGPGADVKVIRAGRGGVAQAGRVRKTAATVAGLAVRPLGWADVFRRRMFVQHHGLPDPWLQYYWRRVKTAALGAAQTEHRLKYAF